MEVVERHVPQVGAGIGEAHHRCGVLDDPVDTIVVERALADERISLGHVASIAGLSEHGALTERVADGSARRLRCIDRR